MEDLEAQKSFYAAYDQDARNKAPISPACRSSCGRSSWLSRLRFKVAGVDAIAVRGSFDGGTWFGALFVGGWILQLVGYAFEGRRPALIDNLCQIFVAPIFLCAEIFSALGYKRGLHTAVQERALRMLAAA